MIQGERSAIISRRTGVYGRRDPGPAAAHHVGFLKKTRHRVNHLPRHRAASFPWSVCSQLGHQLETKFSRRVRGADSDLALGGLRMEDAENDFRVAFVQQVDRQPGLSVWNPTLHSTTGRVSDRHRVCSVGFARPGKSLYRCRKTREPKRSAARLKERVDCA